MESQVRVVPNPTRKHCVMEGMYSLLAIGFLIWSKTFTAAFGPLLSWAGSLSAISAATSLGVLRRNTSLLFEAEGVEELELGTDRRGSADGFRRSNISLYEPDDKIGADATWETASVNRSRVNATDPSICMVVSHRDNS